MFENIKNSVFERKGKFCEIYDEDNKKIVDALYIPIFPDEDLEKKVYLKEAKIGIKLTIDDLSHDYDENKIYGDIVPMIVNDIFNKPAQRKSISTGFVYEPGYNTGYYFGDRISLNIANSRKYGNGIYQFDKQFIIKDKVIGNTSKFVLGLLTNELQTTLKPPQKPYMEIKYELAIDADYIILE